MEKIEVIIGQEILNSRGTPTVEVELEDSALFGWPDQG
jgi:enolase